MNSRTANHLRLVPSSRSRELLEELVKDAVELAIYRNDLSNSAERLDESEVSAIVEDVRGALKGFGTCDEEPLESWAKLFNALEDYEHSWSALGVSSEDREGNDDPDTSTLAQSLLIYLEYERTRRVEEGESLREAMSQLRDALVDCGTDFLEGGVCGVCSKSFEACEDERHIIPKADDVSSEVFACAGARARKVLQQIP